MKGKEETVNVDLGIGGGPKKVVLNQPGFDPDTNISYRDNDVEMTRANVIIQPVAASATYMQHQYKNLIALVKDLPSPELQAAMLDMVVMASDIPHKEEVAKRIRDQMGLDHPNPDAMSEEELAEFESKMDDQERIKAIETALQQMTVENADLENRLKDAEIEKTEAETEKLGAETEKLDAETDEVGKEPEPQGFPGVDPNKVETEEGAAA